MLAPWMRMEEFRRAVILDELNTWRAEGLLDDEAHSLMRARYDTTAERAVDPGGALQTSDVPAVPTAVPSVATAPHGTISSVAYTAHLVGGLLLGAALVALVQYFAPVGLWQPLAALTLGTLCAVAAWIAETRRGELAAEAGFASALVAAASVPFYSLTLPLAGLLACGLAVGVALLRQGRTPLAVLATVTFFVGAQHAARIDLLTPRTGTSEGIFLAALLAFGVLLCRQHRATWGGAALSTHAVGIVLATFPALDALGVTDPGIAALCIGIVAGALFTIGLFLGSRSMIATASTMVTLAALSFAFLALGPALAAIVLLLLGAVLVWQAETVKGYFVPKKAQP